MWTWWKQWFSGAGRPTRPQARKRRRANLRVEPLEDRTTPAPVTGNQAFVGSGAANNTSGNFASSAATTSGQTFVNSAGPGGNEQPANSSFTGAITPNLFPPVIVNSLDQSLLQMQAASTFGTPAGQSFFSNFQLLLQQNPNLTASLAQGFTSVQLVPGFFNGTQVLELVTSELIPPARERILPLAIIPNSLRNPLTPFTMPSSGSVLPGESFNGMLPNGGVTPGTPLTGGPLMFRQSPSGTNAAGAISGTVYRDLDASGTHEAREPGIPGVRVILETQRGSTFQFISSTMTDRAGHYAFPGLSVGSYRVRMEAPPGSRAETDSQAVDLKAHERPTSHDFGVIPQKKKGPSPSAPEEPQAAAPRPLLDQVFAAWGGQEWVDSAAVDRVFAEAGSTRTSSVALPQPTLLTEDSADDFAAEDNVYAAAGLLVGAAAAVAEFQFRPDAVRDWDERDRFWGQAA